MANPGFDITVLGTKGGPLEGSTSSFLIKPSRLSYTEILSTNDEFKIISIDAGVGLGRVTELINDEFSGNPNRLSNSLLNYYGQSLQFRDLSYVKSSGGFGLERKQQNGSPIQIGARLFSLVKSFLITHPHLDHISSLAINSPAYGSQSGKIIHGIPSTIKGIKDHIFNNHIWPDLSSAQNGKFFSFKEFDDDSGALFFDLNDTYSVRPFTINHGCIKEPHVDPYYSTAFLIKDKLTEQHILIFGDVESDRVSRNSLHNHSDSQANYRIWEAISDLIIDGKLSSMIIECSTPNQLEHVPLYGHLTPNLLYEELIILNSVILSRIRSRPNGSYVKNSLKGFNCLITHVKDVPYSDIDPKKTILEELNIIEETNKLGIFFTMLLAGQTYSTDN